jgi:hypothetical protein
MIPSRSLESDDLLAAPAEGRLRTIVIGPVKVDRDEIGTAGGVAPFALWPKRSPTRAYPLALLPSGTSSHITSTSQWTILRIPFTSTSAEMPARLTSAWSKKRTKTRRNGSDGSPALARSRAQRQTGRNQVSDMVLTAEATAQTLIIGNRGQGLNHARRSFCCGCCRSPGLKPRP